MYDAISAAAFIPRFVQSRFASDSLYQFHRAFHWHRYSHIFSLSQSHLAKVTFLIDGRLSNVHVVCTFNVFVNDIPKISFEIRGSVKHTDLTLSWYVYLEIQREHKVGQA